MTPGALRVLKELIEDEDADVAAEGGVVFCGNRQTTARVLYELLRMTAVSVSWRDGDKFTYYHINDTGRALVRRPELEQEIYDALRGGQAFTLRDDRVVAFR